jgi:polysaccharide export outer membrane protein
MRLAPFICLASVALLGCQQMRAGAAAPAPPAKALQNDPAHNSSSLGAGDVFEVRVYGEQDLSGVYRVGPDGDIVFPLCQRVHVAELNATALAERIRLCLANGFIKNPQVTILLKEYNSKKVFVFGEVQKPGTFPYEDNMTVVQAITLAGGFNKTASANTTSVIRMVDGQEVKMKVTVQDIALGKAPNFILRPGDIVYVPESFL